MKLGLREANRRFSRVIRAVRAGREVVLTERGRPIAVIAPWRDADRKSPAWQALAGEGLIRPAARKGPMPAPRWRPPTVTGHPISQTVFENRQDRV